MEQLLEDVHEEEAKLRDSKKVWYKFSYALLGFSG